MWCPKTQKIKYSISKSQSKAKNSQSQPNVRSKSVSFAPAGFAGYTKYVLMKSDVQNLRFLVSQLSFSDPIRYLYRLTMQYHTFVIESLQLYVCFAYAEKKLKSCCNRCREKPKTRPLSSNGEEQPAAMTKTLLRTCQLSRQTQQAADSTSINQQQLNSKKHLFRKQVA